MITPTELTPAGSPVPIPETARGKLNGRDIEILHSNKVCSSCCAKDKGFAWKILIALLALGAIALGVGLALGIARKHEWKIGGVFIGLGGAFALSGWIFFNIFYPTGGCCCCCNCYCMFV